MTDMDRFANFLGEMIEKYIDRIDLDLLKVIPYEESVYENIKDMWILYLKKRRRLCEKKSIELIWNENEFIPLLYKYTLCR